VPRPADIASPTTSFANLSLLSPANGPAPHFPGAFGRPISKCTSPSPSERPSELLSEDAGSPSILEPNVPQNSTLDFPSIRREAPISNTTTIHSHSVSSETAQSVSDIEKPAIVPSIVSSIKIIEQDDSLNTEKSPLVGDGAVLQETSDVHPDAPVADLPETNDNTIVVDFPSLHLEPSNSNKEPQDAELEPISGPDCERPAAVLLNPPSPPPPTKVKLSVKDFAMRKKKKKEEEQAAASPIVPRMQLGIEPETAAPESNTGQADASPQPPAQLVVSRPLSPVCQVQTPLESPNTSATPPLKSMDRTIAADQDSRPLPLTNDVKIPSQNIPPNEEHSRLHIADVVMVENNSADRKLADTVPTNQHSTHQIPPEAKTEVAEARLPVHSPIVVDTAPSRSRSPLPELAHRLDRPRQTPAPENAYRPENTATGSESKPSRRVETLVSSSEYAKKENYSPSPLPERPLMGPPRVHQPLARQISQEDGEIISPPPPKPLPLAPRSHTPPTHPRSFHHSGNTSPVRGPPASSLRRPLQPPSYRPQLPSIPNSRPLPSGPRALRGVGNSGPPPQSLSYSSSSASPYLPFPLGRPDGPHMAPRGPSADRERERDRDRMDWDRDRGRATSWSRSRGSGWSR
jgi:uncharacterized protein